MIFLPIDEQRFTIGLSNNISNRSVFNLSVKSHHYYRGDPISDRQWASPIIVTIWKVVFANNFTWIDLDETWHTGLRLEKTKPCTFTAKSRNGFRNERKNMGRRGAVFCDGNDASLLPLSLDRFPPNFPRAHVQVVAGDTWFHIPEKFPLRGRISRKTVILGYKRVPCLWQGYGSRETFCDAYTVSIP